MPTKKRRVGFIPRSDVLDIINRLSFESNLSNSKIINILVEEALYQRGLMNLANSRLDNQNNKEKPDNEIQVKRLNVNNEFSHSFKNSLLHNKYRYLQESEDESIDNEIYKKFLIFLKFQERMKKENK